MFFLFTFLKKKKQNWYAPGTGGFRPVFLATEETAIRRISV
jgi:hypothetical protein